MKKREKAERILVQMTMAFRLPQNNGGNISYRIIMEIVKENYNGLAALNYS